MGNQACSEGCLSDPLAANFRMNAIHERLFPMYVVKVSDFLQMEGAPRPHNVLRDEGLLHEWYPGMFAIFVSHQWLGASEPDPEGKQVEVLRSVLRGFVDGSLQVEPHVASMVYSGFVPTWPSSMSSYIAHGFLFFDWFAIPQITARQEGVNEQETKSEAAKAVQSIPAYVEACSLFLVLAPELLHIETKKLCNYSTWLSRGWCRAELWLWLLSNRADTSVVIVFSATEAEFMVQSDWQDNSIAGGDFTVPADRAVVCKLGEAAAAGKQRHLQSRGPIDAFRFFLAQKQKFLDSQPEPWDEEEFVARLRFESLEDAARNRDGMNGLLCGVYAGDVRLVRRLVDLQADVNRRVRGLGEFGLYDGMTPLIIAARSNQEPEVLRTLIDLRADVGIRVKHTGLGPAGLLRTAAHVQVLLDARADLHSSELPMGLNPLSSIAGHATAEAVAAMLAARCSPNPPLRGVGCGPLQAIAVFARGKRDAATKARMLMAARADLNVRACPSGFFQRLCQSARVRAALWGFDSCATKTRFLASLPGITPLGMAALVGDEALAELFLEAGAEVIPNDRGDTPDVLAAANHHTRLAASLAVVHF